MPPTTKPLRMIPYELLYGYQPQFSNGALRRLTRETERYRAPNELREEARERIGVAQAKWKEYHDKRRCEPPKYDVGEVVFMRRAPATPGEPAKLQPKYRGPLVVVEILPSDTYRVCRLQDPGEGRVFTTTAHVTLLKGFAREGREEETESDAEEDSNVTDGVDDEMNPNSDDLPLPDDADDEEKETDDDAEEEEAPIETQASTSAVERPRRQQIKPKYLHEYVCDEPQSDE